MLSPTFICLFTLGLLAPLSGATLTFLNTTDGGNTFLYSGSVQNNQEVKTGDQFIIFDFAALLDGQGPSLDWAFTFSQDVSGQADNPTISDAYFTYTGLNTILGLPGQTPLGTFLLTTSATGVHLQQGSYVFETTRSGDGGNTGNDVTQSGTVTVAATPEPGAILLVGGGLALVAVGRRKVSRGYGPSL